MIPCQFSLAIPLPLQLFPEREDFEQTITQEFNLLFPNVQLDHLSCFDSFTRIATIEDSKLRIFLSNNNFQDGYLQLEFTNTISFKEVIQGSIEYWTPIYKAFPSE